MSDDKQKTNAQEDDDGFGEGDGSFECVAGPEVVKIGLVFATLPIIKRVVAGTWAEQNGIQDGDHMESVNGLSIEGMTLDTLKDEMKKRPLSVRIFHPTGGRRSSAMARASVFATDAPDAAQTAEQEKVSTDKASAEKAAAEKAVTEQKAAVEKATAEKLKGLSSQESAPKKAPIKAGDAVPSVEMHDGFVPTGGKTVNVAELTKLVQVPGYLKNADKLKAKGVEKVFVYCSNDGATMDAWAKDQQVQGTIVKMLGDPSLTFTKACGMVMCNAPPFLGEFRCKRWAMIVENGFVRNVEESWAPDDAGGDANPEGPLTAKTRVEHILTLL